MCPHCNCDRFLIKRGTYRRPSDNKKIQQFHCKKCNKSHSNQTHSLDYRQRKRHINQLVRLPIGSVAFYQMSQLIILGCLELTLKMPSTDNLRDGRQRSLVRDNIKRMARRTWYTTKRIDLSLRFFGDLCALSQSSGLWHQASEDRECGLAPFMGVSF